MQQWLGPIGFLFIFLTSFAACQSEQTPASLPIPTGNQSISKDSIEEAFSPVLLYFQKEQRLESRRGNTAFQALAQQGRPLPIGAYRIQSIETNQLKLQAIGQFYQQKRAFPRQNEANSPTEYLFQLPNCPELAARLATGKALQLIIFPNDPRPDHQFIPCFACPHWMAEQYSHLGRRIRQFPKPTQIQPLCGQQSNQ